MHKIDFSDFNLYYKTSFTFQLLQLSDAMGPVYESGMDKVKEMTLCSPDQNSVTVGNLQVMNKTDIPSGPVLKCVPKCLHISPGACHS